MPPQPALLRRLGLGSAVALVIANMIGTGIFTTTGFLAGDLGQPRLILLIWIVGAIGALLGAICYSELAINFPRSGGEYVYLSRAYGPTWGFITGCVSFLAGFSAPIAAAALSFASYVAFFFPHWQRLQQQIFACLLVGLFSLTNLFGIRRAAQLQNTLTVSKLVLLIGFALSGLLLGHGDWHHFSQAAVRTTDIPVSQQFAVSLFWVYVAYSGWNAAAYVAEEVKNPERTLGRAFMMGTALVAVLYLLLNVTFFYGTAPESMKGVMAVGALAASHLFGPRIAGAFSALMACSLLSTINAMTMAGPRVYYAMARDGQFLQLAGTVHERWRTPVKAILIQALCTALLVFTPFPQLVIYIGFTLNLFAVMSVASLFIFRRQPQWRRTGTVSFAYPLVPCLFMTLGIWMTIEGIRQQPLISGLVTLTLASGGILHWLRSKNTGQPIIEA